MDFPEQIVKDAWDRADEKCECEMSSCGHGERCNKPLIWSDRGDDPEGWEAHHKIQGDGEGLGNCKILCQLCHKNTRTFGSPK
ncbi:MAG: hypothetical protein KKA79_07075 [Nanoarchaeota archaeon]|nr:hypothetical protein [Nanoarchaeota archaeon]